MSGKKTSGVTKRTQGPPEKGNELRTDRNKKKILKLFGTGKTWREVAAEMECDKSSIQAWMNSDTAFKQAYREAKEDSADYDLDEIRETGLAMDQPLRDEDGGIIYNQNTGEPCFPDRDAATRARTKIEALKISTEKRSPKRFGALVKLASDEDMPLQIVVQSFAGKENLLDGPVEGGVLEAEYNEVDEEPDGSTSSDS